MKTTSGVLLKVISSAWVDETAQPIAAAAPAPGSLREGQRKIADPI